MSYSHRTPFIYVCIALLAMALIHPGKTSPISTESAQPPNPANCDLTKSNSTSVSAAAEPEPVAEPKPAETETKPASSTTNTTTNTPKSAESKTTASTTTTTTTTTTTKPVEAVTTTTTTTPKPTTKSAATTTPTTTTVKPAPVLNITEIKSESVPKPVESQPLKVETRDGKALNHKTEYEHASPEPESGKPISGNSTIQKNDTLKNDAGKAKENLTMAPVVNETVEKKNASLTMEGKKPEAKTGGHGAGAMKDEPAKNGTTNSTTTTAQPSPTAAANINGSPSVLANHNLVISFLSLSFLVFTTKDPLC